MTTTAPASERTAEELRQQTLDWLRENLPEGWIEAVDDGDHERMAGLRKQLEYGEWCVRLGEAGYATPTWPAEYGAGLSLSPGQAKAVNDVLNHYRVPRPFNIIGLGMGDRGAAAAAAPAARHQRGDLVPAVQRAGGGLRRGRARDQGGARRRRMGRQRPEGMDDAGAHLEVGHVDGPHRSRRAQAPRA